MREIKFKFVIENNGKKYISAEYTLDKDGLPDEETILEDMEKCTCSLNESVNVCEGDCIQFENAKVIDKIQFTGLLDKNKKEIFEGDIIKNYLTKGLEVTWENYPFAALSISEVIGNIYENKEKSICDTAPFPKCNGANGCDTCEYQLEK